MATIQQRINELSTYQQLSPGDPGYVNPATVFLAVDKTGWAKPLKMSLVEFLSTHHIETASFAPSSLSVSVTYSQAFSSSTYYFAELQIYREVEYAAGRKSRLPIPYYDLETTVNGFSFTIEAGESLSGIIITYFASEPSINSDLSSDYIYATGSASGLVVPTSNKTQITGFTSIINKGITLASDDFTVLKTGIYDICINGATLSETAQNLLSIDVYDDTPTPIGITRNFVPRNDYDPFGVNGLASLTEGDVVRFYLSAPAAGLTLDLSTITVNIKQI